MDLFSRYIFRQLAGSFMLILMTLTILIWMSTALAKLDLLTTHGQSVGTMLKMSSLALPALISIVAPNALLVAILYTFDRLNGDSELIVMSAAGSNTWRFAFPCIVLATITCLAVLAFNMVVNPLSLRVLRDYVVQVRTDLISQVLQPGRFSSPEHGLSFHIRDRSPSGELQGLMVHDTRQPDLAMTYLAEHGQIITNSEGSYLVMKDGHIHRQELAKPDEEIKIVAFEQYIFDISQYGSKTENATLRRSELYLHELLNPDPDSPDYQRNPSRYTAEIHDRFSSAIYPLTYVMIVISILARPRTVRESKWAGIALALSAAVILRAAGLAATNASSQSQTATLLAYGIPTGAIIVAGSFAQVKMTPYTWLRINPDAFTKFRILNEKIFAMLGVKTEQNGGHLG
jgi:lipopolysaccharide export system permease protein